MQIGRCLLRNQPELRQSLQKIRRAAQAGKPFDRMLSRLEVQIAASVAQATERAASLPRPTFPDELPIAARRKEIADAIAANQVVIICGETGSGKTTQLPKICLELGRGVVGMIGHTQPRRIAARSVAARIAHELQTPLGRHVGYKIRFSDAMSDHTAIKVMTDGILLAETQRDRHLRAYDTLIIDEAHERSLNIDFLLGYLRQLLPRRPDLKVIITSATIDPQRFSEFFNNAPIIEVSGRTYPVEVRYRPARGDDDQDEADPALIHAILQTVDELAAAEDGDMLVFLSGEREIRETANALRAHAMPGPPVEILPLYARLSNDEQQRVFAPHSGRRIVLATNIAETSLTVPGIRCVIDPGLVRISRFSPQSRVQRLPIEPVSQASANQRAGRCGRIGPGICVRLYTEEDFAQRPAFTDPEILRANLASVILQMKALGLGPIEHFGFIDPPRSSAVREGYQTLHELGAVDERGELTTIGKQLSRLPVDPRLGRMIIAAHQEGALREVLIIASALATQDPRLRPPDAAGAADLAHAQFVDERSDFMTFLKIWEFFHTAVRESSSNQLRKKCRQHFLSYVRLREWADVHRQLLLLVREAGFALPRTAAATYEDIHRSLLAGLLGNIGTRGEAGSPGEYEGVQNRKFHIFPGSTLFKKGPRWIVAGELVETTRLYARTVGRVQPEWVERYAEHLVKRSYTPPHWNAQSAHVEAFERVTLHGLTIIPKRRVHFGRVNRSVARELFIHHALVEGEYRTNAPFAAHNRQMIEQLRIVEAKRRRRDVLVDSEALFAFYDQRVPADVVNGPLFEKWRRRAEDRDPRILFMTRENVLRHDASDVSAEQFPDALEVNGMLLPLTYRLEPGQEQDGVTLTVPIEALAQVHDEQMQWVVPGVLEEKIVELLRTLPKEVRRHFVPAPTFAAACAREIEFGEGSLLEAVTEQLDRMTGVAVSPALWRPESVPDHLRMNFNVVDAQGKTLAEGRDLARLRASLNGAASGLGQAARNQQEIETPGFDRDGVTTWDFGALPDRIERESAGITVHAYPAIIDRGDSVSLRLLDSPDVAARQSRVGLRRLFVLAMREELDSQVEHAAAPGIAAFVAEFSGSQAAHVVEQDIADLIADRAFIGDAPEEIRTPELFEHRLNLGWANLWPVTNQIAEVLGRIAEAHRAMRDSIQGIADNPHWAAARQDIAFQLDNLMPAHFITSTPYEWLQNVSRYLHAIVIRLRRLTNAGLERDQQRLEEIGTHWRRYQQRLARHSQRRFIDPNLEHYRWMIEELRVALFAPELKSSLPVSSRRLDLAWQAVKS